MLAGPKYPKFDILRNFYIMGVKINTPEMNFGHNWPLDFILIPKGLFLPNDGNFVIYTTFKF